MQDNIINLHTRTNAGFSRAYTMPANTAAVTFLQIKNKNQTKKKKPTPTYYLQSSGVGQWRNLARLFDRQLRTKPTKTVDIDNELNNTHIIIRMVYYAFFLCPYNNTPSSSLPSYTQQPQKKHQTQHKHNKTQKYQNIALVQQSNRVLNNPFATGQLVQRIDGSIARMIFVVFCEQN
jgi:hypothetical protein